jgi:hypothetical protein
MSIELPILRIGLAGFTLELQEHLLRLLPTASPSGLTWEFAKFSDADALWINGARTQYLADGTFRIAAGVPSGRSLQINLADVDRPVAFATPVPRNFEPDLQFDPGRAASVSAVLGRLETWLQPLIAQFSVASQILEQEGVLGSGLYHVTSPNGLLLASVNLRGDVRVLPSASPLDFEDAMWMPRTAEDPQAVDHFSRVSLSHLMWQYALRTGRDVLPPRYRTETLYFRRPPRLSQRLLRDSHLLLLRELAVAPGKFADLQQRTGIVGQQMARDLAALYLVGAITSNVKRAAPSHVREEDSINSMGPSGLPSGLGPDSAAQLLRVRRRDLTVPAPLSFE